MLRNDFAVNKKMLVLSSALFILASLHSTELGVLCCLITQAWHEEARRTEAVFKYSQHRLPVTLLVSLIAETSRGSPLALGFPHPRADRCA